MSRRPAILAVIVALCLPAWATKSIPNGSSSQSITVVMRDAAGAPVTGIDVTNLDLYCTRDGDKMSAKVDLTALDSAGAEWSSGKAFEIGLGQYRIDIPDVNLSDGVGQMLTYAVDDAVGTNVTAFYEVQLTGVNPTYDPNGYIAAKVMITAKTAGLSLTQQTDANSLTAVFATARGITKARMASIDTILTGIGEVIAGSYSTTVAAGTHTTQSLILSTGPTADNWFGNRAWFCVVIDADNSIPGGSVIQSYTGASRTVKLEKALPFTPAQNDVVLILPAGPMNFPNWKGD